MYVSLNLILNIIIFSILYYFCIIKSILKITVYLGGRNYCKGDRSMKIVKVKVDINQEFEINVEDKDIETLIKIINVSMYNKVLK